MAQVSADISLYVSIGVLFMFSSLFEVIYSFSSTLFVHQRALTSSFLHCKLSA